MKQIHLDRNGDMVKPLEGDFSFENVRKQMDFINHALYGKRVFNGATELSGDRREDFADVSAEANKEEDGAFSDKPL